MFYKPQWHLWLAACWKHHLSMSVSSSRSAILSTREQKHEAENPPVDISGSGFIIWLIILHHSGLWVGVSHVYPQCLNVLIHYVTAESSFYKETSQLLWSVKVSDREIGRETCGNTCWTKTNTQMLRHLPPLGWPFPLMLEQLDKQSKVQMGVGGFLDMWGWCVKKNVRGV